MAVFMPISRPLESSRAPPELPGLIAASVWITLVIGRPDGEVTSRPRPETTPTVRVWSRPNGLPIARVVCPTRSVALSPMVIGSAALLASILSTATSLSGLYPTSFASYLVVRPSLLVSTTLAAWAPLITWKLRTGGGRDTHGSAGWVSMAEGWLEARTW